MRALDLFSAAAGGWSLGLHRAGFKTIAACEFVEWRRTLYAENNPGVPIYDDVCTLTAARLLADLGTLPDIVVGSPPCQDISSANTKGKGVDGERSGLFFEAIRIIGEVRPRWFALENSANLRTRGADAVLSALEALDYACWTFVVGGDDIGANHERKRSWIIGCDVAQLADTPRLGRLGRLGRLAWAGDFEGDVKGLDRGFPSHDHGDGDAADTNSNAIRISELPRGYEQEAPLSGDIDRSGNAVDAASFGHEGGRSRRHGADGDGSSPASEGAGSPPDADQARQAHGCLESSLRQAEIAVDGCGSGRSDEGSRTGQVGLCEADRSAAFQHRADWSLDDLAAGLLLDDGLPAWVAGARVAVGGPRGTSAASLIVEAFGDSVLPQIPEAIGRAILRVEDAMAALYRR